MALERFDRKRWHFKSVWYDRASFEVGSRFQQRASGERAGTEDQIGIMMDATGIIDEQTTIIPAP